jgi:sporulation protein YlmC with PRC-barrel domain
MNRSSTTLLAITLSVVSLPFYSSAQQTAPPSSEQPGQQQKLEESAPGSLKTSPQSPVITGSSGQSDTLISVQALTNSKVLDAQNREMGSVKNIMIDPRSGKLVRADISLGRGGVLGMGDGDQRFSVPWEQLSLKRQEGQFVLVLNREVVETIRTEKEKETNQPKRAAESEQKTK